jgi:hypothetical protein
MTVNGKLSLSRYSLKPANPESKKRLLETEGLKRIVPFDIYIGADKLPFKMTVGAMLTTAYWAQNQMSYRRASDAISSVSKIETNPETVRLVAEHVGRVVFDEDVRTAFHLRDKFANGGAEFGGEGSKDGVVYVQTDGAALNTRSKDADGSTWRENKLGLVFSSDNIRYWTDVKGNRQHRILKREYVSYVGGIDVFKWLLLSCAVRNGYGKYKKIIVLGDGATWIRNMVAELYPDAQQILDFFHLCENVYEFARALFNMDEAKYRPWAEGLCGKLKASKYREVLRDLQKYKDNPLSNSKVNLYQYIENNISNIDYAKYLQGGYFIGSGAIESGNRLVLQQRLKQPGMRWNESTAQPLLTLRAKYESGLWEKDVVDMLKKMYRTTL